MVQDGGDGKDTIVKFSAKGFLGNNADKDAFCDPL